MSEKITQLPNAVLINPSTDFILVSQRQPDGTYLSVKAPAQRGNLIGSTTLNLQNAGFQPITLVGGTEFYINDVLITNANVTPQSSTAGIIYDSDKTTDLFDILSGTMQTLTSASKYISFLGQTIGINTNKTVGNTIYWQRGAEINPRTVDIYIYGNVIK